MKHFPKTTEDGSLVLTPADAKQIAGDLRKLNELQKILLPFGHDDSAQEIARVEFTAYALETTAAAGVKR